MAENEFLLRFNVDMSKAEAKLSEFSAKTKSKIAEIQNIPVGNVGSAPQASPALRVGGSATAEERATAFGVARQSALGPTATVAKIGSATSAARREFESTIASGFGAQSKAELFGAAPGTEEFKRLEKIANSASLSAKKLLQSTDDAATQASLLNSHLGSQVGSARQAAAAEKALAEETEKQAAHTAAALARKQRSLVTSQDPEVIAAAEANAAAQGRQQANNRYVATAARKARQAELAANHDEAFYTKEAELQNSILVDEERLKAAKQVAYNKAILASDGRLLRETGAGEVADQSTAAAIHGERARQLLNQPYVQKQIINDDTVARKEAAIREGQVAENLANDEKYLAAKTQSSVALKREAAVVEAGTAEKLAGDTQYQAALLQSIRAREVEKLAILQATTQEDVIRQAQIGATAGSIQTRVRAAQLQLETDAGLIKEKAETIVLQRVYNKQLKEAVAAELSANGQKLAAFQVRYGRGGVGGGNQDTASGLAGAGAISSLTHILPTLALFAAAGGIAASVKEAQELEIKLTNINFQLKQVGQEESFGKIKDDILSLARETGIASTKIAEIRYQVQGAFGGNDSTTGKPIELNGLSGKALVDQQTQSVAKISALTGFDPQKVIDSLTAVGLAFDVTGKQVGNAAYQLETKFGVRAQETLDFLGDIAPVAKEAGFSIEEFATIAAISQQRSGQTGSAIAEKFSRVITGIAEKKKDLAEIIAGDTKLGSNEDLLKAVNINDTRAIILEIAKVFNGLDKITQDKLSNVLGGPRNFQAILPALQSGDLEKQSKEINTNLDTLDQRFEKFNETLTQQLKQAGEALKQIGIAIYDAGLKDALGAVVDILKLVGNVLGPIVRLFASFNEALGGVPAKALVAAGALKLLSGINDGSKLSNILNLKFGSSAGAAATGAASAESSIVSEIARQNALGASIGAKTAAFNAAEKAKASKLLALNSGVQSTGLDPIALGPVPVYSSGTATPPGRPGYTNINAAVAAEKEAATAVGKVSASSASTATALSGFGSTLGGAASKTREFINSMPKGVALAAAAFAIYKLVEVINSFIADAESQRNNLSDRVAAKPRDQQQKDIDYLRSKAKDFNLFENLLGYDPNKAADEAQRKIDASGRQAVAENLLGKTDFVNGADRKLRGPNNQQKAKSYKDRLNDALGKLRENSGDEGAAKEIDSIIEEYKKIDPGFAATIDQLKADAIAKVNLDNEKKKLNDADRKRVEDTTTDLQGLLSDYQAGTATVTEVTAKYDQLISVYEKLTKQDGADPTIIAALKKAQLDKGKLVSNALKQTSDSSREYNALVSSSVDSSKFAITQDKGLLADPRFTDKEARLAVAKDIVAQNDKLNKAKLDSFTTATEAIAYLNANPPKVDQDAQLAIIDSQLSANNVTYSEFLDAWSRTKKTNGEAFIKNLIKDIVTGKTKVEDVIADLQKQKAIAESIQLADGTKPDTSVIDQQLKLIQELDAAGFFKSSQDTTEQQKALNEKAHGEAVAGIKAQYDLYKSMIDGDAVATAQVAVQEAQAILGRASEPGSKPEEAAAALAQLNQAKINLRKAARANFLAEFDVRRSETNDSVVQAQIDVQKAEAALASATPDERNSAIVTLNNARRALYEKNRQNFLSEFDVLKSQTDDPLQQAQIDVQKAEAALASAGPDERNASIIALNNARKAQRQAIIADEDARAAYAKALVAGDPVKAAQFAQADARRKFAEATTAAEKLQAMAAMASADREFADAVSAVFSAQAAYATALADYRGDDVESSKIAYNEAVRQLNEVWAKFQQGQAGEAQVLQAQAAVKTAQGRMRDSQLNSQLEEYSFLYDMDKISKGQYIAYLQQLKNLPDLTTKELQSIDRQIKNLKAELGQDLQFNVPNEIKLPTLYEARRLDQTGGTYGEKGSPIGYQDNKVVSIQISITDGQSKAEVLNAITDAVGGPSRFSAGTRRY